MEAQIEFKRQRRGHHHTLTRRREREKTIEA